ncbi:winged helix-turn-helix domain-containing protein [Dokdonella sp.]|uniref:winged helix-turn-helix domain-containing protein n=1 Tax=Dokdonella sp. TaxID=2291710 RepID=UPI003784398A
MRYRIHEFELDVEGGQLIGPTGVVPLRRQVLLTLCHLLQRAPDLVPNDELLDAVWGRQAISPNVVPQAMRELRRAFGDDAREPRFIETRHRLGYRFIAPVQRINGAVPGASADAPAASMPEADSARALPASSRPEPRAARSTWRTVLLACTVIAVAGVAAVLLYPGRQVADASAPVLAEVLPRDAEARQAFHAALVARGHGDLAAAERNLRNAIRREPQSVASSADLARVLAEQGRFDDARHEAQRAAELNAPLSRSDALRLQALQAELDFDCSRAAELYRSVFAFEPGDVESAYRLFECELSLAERAGAESTLAAIAKTLGDRAAQANPRLLLARARLAADNGQPQEQHDFARRVLQACTDDSACGRLGAAARRQLAAAQLKLGAVDTALAEAARAAQEAEAGGHASIAASATLLKGVIAREQGRLDDADRDIREAQRRYTLLGDESHATEAEREATVVMRVRGDTAGALKRLSEIERTAASRGDLRARASTLLARGMTELPAGQPEAALASLEQAREFFVTTHDAVGEAAAQVNLGSVYGRLERHAEAKASNERALALFRQLGDKRGQAFALGNLAISAGIEGQAARKRELTEQSLALFRDIGARMEVGRIQFNLGIQDRRDGDLALARTRFAEAWSAFDELHASAWQQRAAASLAMIDLERADLEAAAALLDKSPPDAAGGEPLHAAALHATRARLFELRGDLKAARLANEQALGLRQKSAVAAWVDVSELDLARIDLLEGELTRAEVTCRRLAQRMEDPRDAAAAELLLAQVLIARDRRSEAARLLENSTLRRLDGHPDAALVLESELMLALAFGADRERLAMMRETAERGDFQLLALRASLAESASAALPPSLVDALEKRGLTAWSILVRALSASGAR